MLKESKDVSQKELDSGIVRRWFHDEYFDLIVWYAGEDSISGFQLCYGKDRGPHALTWRRDRGFFHDTIDEGGDLHNIMTPILVADGPFPFKTVSEKFRLASESIDPGISGLVLSKLDEYGRR